MSENDLNPKKRGLGRGLDALFESEEGVYPQVDQEGQTPAGVQRKVVGIEQLQRNPDQPRKTFNEDALKELAASLSEYGILQPILVRPLKNQDDQYEIIAGERRWRAAQIAQLHEIPVVVRDLNNSEALQIGLVENLQREDLNPIEEALGYRQLLEEYGHTQQKVAELVGKSRSQVTNMIRLLNLPESIQDMLQKDEISVGHARALINKDNAEELAQKIRNQDMSVRDIEALTASNTNKKTSSAPKALKDPDTRALEKEMSDNLGMIVNINVKGDGHKGDVKINFQSLDQLDFLLHKLSKH